MLDVGTRAGGRSPKRANAPTAVAARAVAPRLAAAAKPRRGGPTVIGSRIDPEFTFDSFVEGKSNQLAKAAAMQVAGNPGKVPITRCSSTAASVSARRT